MDLRELRGRKQKRRPESAAREEAETAFDLMSGPHAANGVDAAGGRRTRAVGDDASHRQRWLVHRGADAGNDGAL